MGDEAAVLVDVHPALGLAVFEGLYGVGAAVFAVPDDAAVCGVVLEVVRVGVFFEDEGRGLRGVAVLVVVLDDAAAVGGFAQRFAVVAACAGGFCRVAVWVEVPGLAVCFGAVVEGEVGRLFGVQHAFGEEGGLWRGGGQGFLRRRIVHEFEVADEFQQALSLGFEGFDFFKVGAVVAGVAVFVPAADFAEFAVGRAQGGDDGTAVFAVGDFGAAVVIGVDVAEGFAIGVVEAQAAGNGVAAVGVVFGVAAAVVQRHLCGEAAVLVDVEAAVVRAVAVVLHGFDAAVFAVPDGFAVGVVAVEVVRVAVVFEDEGCGLRGVVVLVVVLHDAAAVGGLSQCFAVVAAGAGGFGRVAVVVEIPGLFVAGGVVQRDGRRLFGVEDVFRQGGGDARRGGEGVHGDFGFFGLFRGGLRVQ